MSRTLMSLEFPQPQTFSGSNFLSHNESTGRSPRISSTTCTISAKTCWISSATKHLGNPLRGGVIWQSDTNLNCMCVTSDHVWWSDLNLIWWSDPHLIINLTIWPRLTPWSDLIWWSDPVWSDDLVTHIHPVWWSDPPSNLGVGGLRQPKCHSLGY